MIFIPFVISLIFTWIIIYLIIPRLKKVGIVGADRNKSEGHQISEMGGLGIVSGFTIGLMCAIFLKMFFSALEDLNIVYVLAALSTVLMIAIVGIFDDLLELPQGVKAFIPILAALPLIAIKAGYTKVTIPFIGKVDFGIFYSLILVPLGVTGAANAFNILAGFNGLEVGMGAVATLSLSIIAYSLKSNASLIILLTALGALISAMYFNWYPAKIFIGDVGTLSIGAIVACAVIIGNFEMAGIVLIIPYAIDFVLKAINKFPSYSFGIYKNGKLYCPENGPVGLAQLIMKITGGIHERNLVLILIFTEAILGVIAVLLYAKF